MFPSSSSSLSLSPTLTSISLTHYPPKLHFCNKNGAFRLSTLSLSISSPSTTIAPSTRRRTEISGEHRISSLDYLTRSLDLSPESIVRISKRKQFEISSISHADSVLALFRDYGFSTSQISTVFANCPRLLLYAPASLKLKLDFFAEYGVSGDALRRAITSNQFVLTASLERKIAPCFAFLADFFGNRQAVFSLFSIRNGLRFVRCFNPAVAQNSRTLRLHGVPDSSIVLMMVRSMYSAKGLSHRTETFEACLGEVKRMGFQRSSTMFISGLSSMLYISRENWASKEELFKKFGCTEEQVRSLFLKQPTVMNQTEKSLEKRLRFFFHKVEWTFSDVFKYPAVLNYSFEERVLPRLAVLEFLKSRGLVGKRSFGRALQVSDALFLNQFVDKYRATLPHLLEVYQSNFS